MDIISELKERIKKQQNDLEHLHIGDSFDDGYKDGKWDAYYLVLCTIEELENGN